MFVKEKKNPYGSKQEADEQRTGSRELGWLSNLSKMDYQEGVCCAAFKHGIYVLDGKQVRLYVHCMKAVVGGQFPPRRHPDKMCCDLCLGMQSSLGHLS